MGELVKDPGSGSLLEISGAIDFSAPRVQILTSPVSGAPITMPALPEGYLFPRRWTEITVKERVEPVVLWEDTLARNPSLSGTLGQTTRSEQNALPSVGETFIIKSIDTIKSTAASIGTQTKNAGVFVIVALVLILLIKRK